MPCVLRRQFDRLIVKCMSTLFFLAAVSISQGRRRGWQLAQQLTPQVLRLPVKDQTTRKGDVKQSLGVETGISPACYFEQVPKIPAWEVKQTNRQGKRK